MNKVFKKIRAVFLAVFVASLPALSAAGRGKDVLLIDMDPQANLSQFFIN